MKWQQIISFPQLPSLSLGVAANNQALAVHEVILTRDDDLLPYWYGDGRRAEHTMPIRFTR